MPRKNKNKNKNRKLQVPRSLGAFTTSIKLSYTYVAIGSASTGALGISLSLSYALRSSNDWDKIKALYASFSPNRCDIDFYPHNHEDSTFVPMMVGYAYDHFNSAGLSQLNQIPDYENWGMLLINSPSQQKTRMSLKLRPTKPGPYQTDDTTEFLGWMKLFAAGNTSWALWPVVTMVFSFFLQVGGVQ
jgi:hypothetical protein